MLQKDKTMKAEGNKIQFFLLFLYFVSISAFQLGKGFDAIFVRLIFFILLCVTLFINKKIILTENLKWSCLFWAYYMSSCLWAKNIDDTTSYINNMLQIVGIFLIFPLIVKDIDDVKKILKLLVYSLLFTSILILVRTPINSWGTERIGAVIGLHPNTIGLRMAIGVVISLYFIHESINENKKKSIFFYLICILLFIIPVLFSGSKKALLLLIVGTILFELINAKGSKWIFKATIFSIIGIMLIFFIFNNEMLYSIIGRRVERMYLTLTQGDSIAKKDTDGSLLERNFYIEQALNLFFENPIIGYGGNNFVTRMREINYSHVAYSHNNFVEILATLGVVGFIIYYSYWLLVLTKLFLKLKYIKNKRFTSIFFILIMMLLILDYGNVSYTIEFNAILLGATGMYLEINNKGENSETKKNNEIL